MHRSNHFARSFVVAAAVTSFVCPPARAGEIVQVGTYGDLSIDTEYNDDQVYEPNYYYASSAVVEGFEKFDPSLGQLREVRLSTDFTFQYDYGFDAQGILNTSTGSYYSGSFALTPFGGSIGLAPAEQPGYRYTVVSYGTSSINLMKDGVVGADDGEVSDGRNESGTIATDEMLNFSSYAMNNFIRRNAGDVTLEGLVASVDVPTTAQFGLINLSGAFGAAHSNLTGGTATLTYVFGTLGDVDGDDEVGFNDLLVLAQNYNGTSGKAVQDGDLTGDGKVDFDDLLALAKRYGTTADGSASLGAFDASFADDWARAQSLVPEPATLASLSLIALVKRRRR